MDASMGAGSGDLKPRAIGELITAAFEVYKAHWQRLVTIAAIITVPLYFVIDLIVWLASKGETAAVSTTVVNGQVTDIHVSTTAVWVGALTGFVAIGALFLVSFIVEAAIARGAASSIVGDPSTDEAYRYGLKRIGSFIWIAILVGVIVGFAPFVLMILLTLVIPALFVIWLLLMLVAIFFLGTMLSVAIPSLVIENKRGMEALNRSYELVKSHFWHVFGAFFVGGLIASVVQGVIHAVFGFGGWIVNWVGDSLAAVIAMPFMAIVAVVIYLDVRARKENLTMDQLRQELASSGPST